MSIYFLGVLLSLSCCASTRGQTISPVQPDKPTVIYSGNVRYEDTREVVKELLARLLNPFNYEKHYSELVSEWTYEYIDTYIIVEDPGTQELVLADGYTDKENKIIYVYLWQPCLAASSLPHELMHAIGYYHEDRLAWEAFLSIHREIIDELCSEGYKVNPPPPPSKSLLKRINERQKELRENR